MCEQSDQAARHGGGHGPAASRAEFHREQAGRARAEAQRLHAARAQMGGQWLGWVAHELYAMSPAPFAAMVRRELQRLMEA